MMGSGGERMEVMRKKLAVAVKSIEWSYSIFWSLSSTQSGVLEWGDGYYNGDIKTRKTVLQENSKKEDDDDEFGGTERTEQIIQLYEELLSGSEIDNPNPQPKRPNSSVSLSPEDLTDSEWYFLVCMSFSFPIGHGLPGRTFSSNQMIWLCNAHHADSKVFTRSLLAKSASIQTVVCFPYIGGVIELGVTELVLEDPNIIQHIKASFSEIPQAIASNISTNDREVAINLDQVQSLQDDEISNPIIQISTSSSDYCASQTLTSTKMVNDGYDPKLTSSFVSVMDDGHYKRVLSTLLKTPNSLISGSNCRNSKIGSSFVSWKKGDLSGSDEVHRNTRSQRLLKKVIFEVGLMSGINERFSILKELVPFSSNKVDKVSMLDNTIKYLKEVKRKIEELESCKKNKGSDVVEKTSDNYGDKRILIKKNKNIVKINKRKSYFTEEIGVEKIHNLTEYGPSDDVINDVIVRKIDMNVIIDINCNWKENLFLELVGAIKNLDLDTHSIQSSNVDGIISLTMKAQMKFSTNLSVEEIRRALQRIIQKRLRSL